MSDRFARQQIALRGSSPDPEETDPLSAGETFSLALENFRLTEMSSSQALAYEDELTQRREVIQKFYEDPDNEVNRVFPVGNNGNLRKTKVEYGNLMKQYDQLTRGAPPPVEKWIHEGKLIKEDDPENPGQAIFRGRDGDWSAYASKNQQLLQNWNTLNTEVFSRPEFEMFKDSNIRERVINKTNTRRMEIAKELEAGDPNAGMIFLGGMAGAMTDPVNIAVMVATAPIGGATGYGLWGNAWRAGVREATINGVSEATIQADVMDWYKELGESDYGINKALMNIGMASAGGFIFGGIGSTSYDLNVLRKSHGGMEAFKRWDRLQGYKLNGDIDNHFDVMQQAELQSINWQTIDLETRFAMSKADAQTDSLVYVRDGDDVFTGKVIDSTDESLTVQTFDPDGNMKTETFNREDGTGKGNSFLDDEATSPLVKDMDDLQQSQGRVTEPDPDVSLEQVKAEQLETDTADLDLGYDYDADFKALDEIEYAFGLKERPQAEGEIKPKEGEAIEGQAKEGEQPSDLEPGAKEIEPEPIKEVEKPTATKEQIESAKMNIANSKPEVAGALLGFEQDEDGNWTYDPIKGAMGAVGARYANRALSSKQMGNAVKKFLDDVEETAMQQAGGGKPPKPKELPAQKSTPDEVLRGEIKEVPLSDLKGKVVMNVPADLTVAGGSYKGIDSTATAPVETKGGPLYPFLQSSVDGKTVWANKGADDFTKILNSMKKMGYDDRYVYAVVGNMAEDTHKSNTTAVHSIFETIKAYEKSGRMSAETAQTLTDDIRSAGTRIKGQKKKDAESIGKQLEEIPHFDDIDNLIKYVDNMTFSGRKELITELEKESLKNAEMPNIAKILDELKEKEFSGWNKGDAQIVFKIDTQDPVAKLGEDGTTKHPSYDYGIKGEPVGKFGRPIHNRVLFPELHRDMMALAEAKGKPESAGENFFYTLMKDNKMVRRVDDDVINTIDSSPYNHIASAQQARLVLDSANNNWRSNAQAKDKVTPLQFERELMKSKAYPTLDQTSEKALKDAIKNEGLKLYALGGKDSKVMYGTKPREDGGIDLHHVVNNEKNAPKAGQLILAHAIEHGGVTDLNAFAVPMPGKPEGMLPNFYKKFGFAEVDRYPFDKQYITKMVDGVEVFDEIRYNDMIHYWKKELGWKESDGYPDVVDMKWRGTDADRKDFTKDIVTGSRTISEEGSSFLDGYGVRRSDTDGAEYPGGDNLGDGTVDGVYSTEPGRSGGNDVSVIYEEIMGLSDAEKKNLGIGG